MDADPETERLLRAASDHNLKRLADGADVPYRRLIDYRARRVKALTPGELRKLRARIILKTSELL